MNPDRLDKRWRRTLRDTLGRIQKLHARPALNAKGVHALRVGLRRARLLLLVGRPLLKSSQVRELRRQARQLLDELGPVRDCDVTLEWLPRTNATRALRRSLRQLRRQQWQRARIQLQQPLPTVRLPAKHRQGDALARLWQQVMAETRSRCAALIRERETLEAAGLHELRRRIRRWRYLLELTARKRVAAEAAAIAVLVKIQEALGVAQNLMATADMLGQLPAAPETRRWQARARSQQRLAHRRALRKLTPRRGPTIAR